MQRVFSSPTWPFWVQVEPGRLIFISYEVGLAGKLSFDIKLPPEWLGVVVKGLINQDVEVTFA